MIIHSIVNDEVIYAGIDDIQSPEELMVNGILMQVERMSNNQVKIVRLISTDPQHYLNDEYSPGKFINFQPSL